VSSTVVLKAAGLITSPNQLDIPDGSLAVADNVIIKRDNVIEPRRGFKLYGDELPSQLDRTKQLSVYRDRIIRHYASTLQYDSDGNGTFEDFTGSFSEAESGIRIKSTESNGNYYFTSSEGIKKISSTSSDGLSTANVQDSGGVKAVDLTARTKFTQNLQNGFLLQDSTVAYRVLWNRRDVNNNLIFGAPSQRSIVTNPLNDLLLRDFHTILLALDNVTDTTDSARIGDGDYVDSLKLPSNASALELHTNLISLVTKIDTDIIYGDDGTSAPIDLVGASGTVEVSGNVATVTKEAGGDFDDYLQTGSEIELSGLVAPNDVLNGTHTVSSVTASTVNFNITTADFGPSLTDSTVVLNSNEYRSITQPAAPATPTTNAELVSIQNYVDFIILRLQAEPPIDLLTGEVITAANQTEFIQDLDITTTSTTILNITIPEEITTDYFIQVYRSPVASATGPSILADILPTDELQLVFEQFITTTNISDGFVELEDNSPDEFRGANLYTNASTGEGILQSNDIPPYAKDIARFRNVVFYANTKTRHRLSISLLGVQKLIDSLPSVVPKLTITDGTNSQTYTFVLGVKEITELTCDGDGTGNIASGASLNGKYFDHESANGDNKYRFYYKTSLGVDTPPSAIDGSFTRTLIRINITTDDVAVDVAKKTRDVFNTINTDFGAADTPPVLPIIEITNSVEGLVTDMSVTDLVSDGFSVAVTQQGVGEDVSTNTVLISSVVSPAQAVDSTARSLIRVINKNDDDIVYAYYLSGSTDVPGQMLFEARDIGSSKFSVIGNNADTGISFNPDISPQFQISGITTTVSDTEITTSIDHTYSNGDNVYLTLTDTTPSIEGLHQIEVTDTDKFKITVPLTVISATTGTVSAETFSQNSENEEKQNRLYYSKFQQPEAVPIVNFFDVGSQDSPILRIQPLRDSLFVFKTDGIFRVSGETSPFNVQLFDSSTKLIADDTVSVVDNVIYCWAEQGIATVSESNVSVISRAIDNDILQIGSASSTNFRKATWGIGYESDNSYIVYTTKNKSDTVATVGYRYGTLTDTWTKITKSTTCGVINELDDTLYMGAGDTNSIEIERKNFDRTDYADREYSLLIPNNSYGDGKVILTDISNIDIGDVITQEQKLTTYQYNRLLDQLDLDSSLSLNLKNGDPDGYISLAASSGDNLRSKIVELATRLDLDSSPTVSDFASTIANQILTITNIELATNAEITTSVAHGLFDGRILTISGTDSSPVIDGDSAVTVTGASTFTIEKEVVGTGTTGTAVTNIEDFIDIKECYNEIVDKLNLDTGVSINNYNSIVNDTTQEAIVTEINTITKEVTLNIDLDFIKGDITLYKAIRTNFRYAPNTMGDPLGYKHLREATLIFESRSFTSATMEFSTDLLPSFKRVDFDLDGNGIFGHQPFGEGFFGGGSNSAPFRTYIPRDAQRCTYIRVGFIHSIAREKYSIFAITVTGKIGQSTRAYR